MNKTLEWAMVLLALLVCMQAAGAVDYKEQLGGRQVTFVLSNSYNITREDTVNVTGLVPMKIDMLDIKDSQGHPVANVVIIKQLDPQLDTADLDMAVSVRGAFYSLGVADTSISVKTVTIDGKKGAEGDAYVPQYGCKAYYSYCPVDNNTLCAFRSLIDDTISNQLIDSIHVT